jgi:hypothetical protein
MKHTKIEAGACDTGPNENCVSTAQSYSKKPAKSPRRSIPPLPGPESGISVAQWRESLVRDGYFKAVEVVDGDLGPIALIGSPRVCVGDLGGSTAVFLERRPWGEKWSNANQLFIGRSHVRSAISYAVKLAEAIRKAALAEEARKDRYKVALLREKFGGAA